MASSKKGRDRDSVDEQMALPLFGATRPVDPVSSDESERAAASDGAREPETAQRALIDPLLWMSASDTRNHVLGDPLLDWLSLFGRAKGFVPDDERPGYDPDTDFKQLLRTRGRAFEGAVVAHIADLGHAIERIANDVDDTRDPLCATRTIDAMRRGTDVIHRGVLHDTAHMTFGSPDLLVRSDVLSRLFPTLVDEECALLGRTSKAGLVDASAPAIGADGFHYRVVDVKFSALRFGARGELSLEGSKRAYAAQVFITNRALAAAQGFQAPSSFLLGRRAQMGKKRVDNAMARLGIVPSALTFAGGSTLASVVDEAEQWIRRMRRAGAAWEVLPVPFVPELWPDLKKTSDAPWHAVKCEIALAQKNVTLLPSVNGAVRDALRREHDITRYDDERLTPALLTSHGAKNTRTLAAVLAVNTDGGPPVRPAQVKAQRSTWHARAPLEFFVDFETVSDLDDDFSRFPTAGGETLLFLIGCGHVDEEGAWQFASFVADALTPEAEARTIDAWVAHMDALKRARHVEHAPVFHWSAAESSTFENAFSAARASHPDRQWPAIAWFDFLTRVVKSEPVVVRGAFGFGLKSIGNALHAQGLIATSWADGPTDGLGAMVATMNAAREAGERGVALVDVECMREVVCYNESDCRVMYEVIELLRRDH
jgi:hypothetical protein